MIASKKSSKGTAKVTLVFCTLIISIVMLLSASYANSIGFDVGGEITTEDFEPIVWLCDNRLVFDDGTEPGRLSYDGEELVERINNYAFEGEQITWTVLVMDKNGVEKINDVFVTLGSSQGPGDIEANCMLTTGEGQSTSGLYGCNARILEEEIYEFDSDTMAFYTCTLTVETPSSMYGEYWVTIEAEDLDGLSGMMDENEYWFFNPVIALNVEEDLEFDEVRPGTSAYSDTILVENDADTGSGVMLDMFISGTDFYDSSSSGAKCPDSNTLELENFAYFAVNGAYSSYQDPRADAEGYVPIGYGIGFNDPDPFYDAYEILQAQQVGPYYTANILAPRAEFALTFRLNLPEPCNGDFDSGSIYFWGEAI